MTNFEAVSLVLNFLLVVIGIFTIMLMAFKAGKQK